jgi:hypothetical protein
MRNGSLTGEFDGSTATEADVMNAAFATTGERQTA